MEWAFFAWMRQQLILYQPLRLERPRYCFAHNVEWAFFRLNEATVDIISTAQAGTTALLLCSQRGVGLLRLNEATVDIISTAQAGTTALLLCSQRGVGLLPPEWGNSWYYINRSGWKDHFIASLKAWSGPSSAWIRQQLNMRTWAASPETDG